MASAMSGFETEKRPTGRSKLITRDCPTRTLTATDSLFLLKDACYEFSWALATVLARMSINDANTKLARRVKGELLCMIFGSFCLLAIDGDLKLMSARFSVLRNLDTALLCALNHFHLC